MKITFCFEYHSMIACDLNDLKKLTFDSLKKFSVALYDLCLSAPGLDFFGQWPQSSFTFSRRAARTDQQPATRRGVLFEAW